MKKYNNNFQTGGVRYRKGPELLENPLCTGTVQTATQLEAKGIPGPESCKNQKWVLGVYCNYKRAIRRLAMVQSHPNLCVLPV